MDRPSITDKRQMYAALARGDFGNRMPQWFDLRSWLDDGANVRYPRWAVRSLQKSDKGRLRLDVLAADVPAVVTGLFPPHGYNLSPFLNQWLTLRFDVAHVPVPPCGLRLTGTFDPALGRGTWFERSGLAAAALLKAFLWPGDYDDLQELLDLYPGHVIEMSAYDRAVGVVPHRNAVVWEVRSY